MYYSKLFLVALLAVAASNHIADAAQLVASSSGVASPHAKRNSNGIMNAKRQESLGEGEGNDEAGLPPAEEKIDPGTGEKEDKPGTGEDDNEPSSPPTEEDDQLVPDEEIDTGTGEKEDKLNPAKEGKPVTGEEDDQLEPAEEDASDGNSVDDE
ncbi:hypothetical protein H4219_005478 [Mycoemilia scoparia]|uniref:Uncharacterized protein n=1 Tax=Mycoemilia scoparia TaxID=417184 RepID=A0A9W7ZSY7_9FUNG|nr:hypothetical protein H4219_005478 [Mycoemilia scoparia]